MPSQKFCLKISTAVSASCVLIDKDENILMLWGFDIPYERSNKIIIVPLNKISFRFCWLQHFNKTIKWIRKKAKIAVLQRVIQSTIRTIKSTILSGSLPFEGKPKKYQNRMTTASKLGLPTIPDMWYSDPWYQGKKPIKSIQETSRKSPRIYLEVTLKLMGYLEFCWKAGI